MQVNEKGEWFDIVNTGGARLRARMVSGKVEVEAAISDVEKTCKGNELKCVAGQAVAALRTQFELALLSVESAAKLLPVHEAPKIVPMPPPKPPVKEV